MKVDVELDKDKAVTTIICSRGRRKTCRFCSRYSTKLCDFPLTGAKAGKTCDEPMCDRCAVHVGPDKDFCPPHYRYREKQMKEHRAQMESVKGERPAGAGLTADDEP